MYQIARPRPASPPTHTRPKNPIIPPIAAPATPGRGPGPALAAEKTAAPVIMKARSPRTTKATPTAIETIRIVISDFARFFRRTAVATARKLGVLIYRALKHGQTFVETGLAVYEKQQQDRQIRNLQKRAAALGFQHK